MGSNGFKLPLGWNCKKLVDCTKEGNISYGIVQPGQHQEDGIGIIRVNNIQNGNIYIDDVLKVSHEIESKFAKTRLEGGEVLLTLVGSTGISAITTKALQGWNVARAVAVIKPCDEISAEWIHICLQSPFTKYFLDSRANTTVQKTLNLKDVKEIPLPIPPHEERVSLEKIYFNFENRINLNIKINKILEEMSQNLFKSWFVDFDPVVDNALDAGNPIPEALQSRAELRQKVRNSADFKPLPAEIRSLFPSEFEET
ncbi:TPA: restriction endonuclease subunit S, partial [Escherichia coli]|nr:restriction endonuclease subunit S [Escherichia coli]